MTESRELATHDPAAGRDIVERRSTSIAPADRLAMMREAMVNPDVNPDKAREMLQLMRELENDERQAEFNRDKGRAIRAMPAIFKKGENTHTGTRYAKFEDMHRAVMPVLAAHFLTLDFRIGYEGRDITVQPLLRHDNGYIEEGGIMKGPADEGKGRSSIQAIGSASSYLKRYSMRAMLNLIEDGEDDDGQGVGRPDYQMNDRQEGLVVDAQRYFELGQYVEWYGRLPTRDKAFLVTSGTHARCGGGTALPGAVAADPAPTPSPAPAPAQAAKAKRTPRELVDDYLAKLNDDDQTGTLDELQALQLGAARFMDNLKANHPALHQEIIDANSARHAKLSSQAESNPAVAGDRGGLFGDDD